MFQLMMLCLASVAVWVGMSLLLFRKKTSEEPEHQQMYSGRRGFWSKSKKTLGIIFLSGGTVAFVSLWIVFSIAITPAGSIKIVKTFGKVDVTQVPLTEGLSFILPWQSTKTMSIRQRQLDRSKGTKSDMDVIADDGTRLNTDVTFYWTLNPVAGAWIYQKFGRGYYNSLQTPSAAGSLRDVVGKVEKWNNLVADKLTVESDATKAFEKSVLDKLVIAGIPKEIASNAFTFPKIDIRRITPPLKILTAIENKKAAVEDLNRQGTEIQIAARKAEKGAQEGFRVRNMLLAIFNPLNENGLLSPDAKLPDNFLPSDIPGIMNSIATKQNAQSIQTAVEQDGVNTILLPAATPVAAPVK